MISLRDVNARAGAFALRDITFDGAAAARTAS